MFFFEVLDLSMAKYLLTFTIRPIVKLESHLRQYSTKLPELKDVGGSYLDKCRPWSDHDNEKLLELVEKHGNKWTLFTNYFPGRSAMHIRQHHLHIAKKYYGLTPEEKNIVQDLLGKEKRVEEIDWEHVQKSLPQRKPIYVIQKYYRFSVNSSFKRGKWTEQETQQLVVLVSKHGKDWRLISQMIETRNENQCIKKYTHEMNMQNAKIGKERRFTSSAHFSNRQVQQGRRQGIDSCCEQVWHGVF